MFGGGLQVLFDFAAKILRDVIGQNLQFIHHFHMGAYLHSHKTMVEIFAFLALQFTLAAGQALVGDFAMDLYPFRSVGAAEGGGGRRPPCIWSGSCCWAAGVA